MWKFGFNVILLGLSNGELHGVCTQPLKDLGIMYVPQTRPLMIGSLSADESLFMCGGADNRLFILNVAWLLDGEQEGA